MKGNIWILKSWKFFACKLCNPESYALDSSIQLKEFLLVIGIQNPSSTDKESRIQFLESRATTDSRIQDRLGLPHMRRWFPSPWGGGGGRGVTQLYTGFVPFFEKKFKYFTFPIFQGLHQCKKAHWVYVFVRFSKTWVVSGADYSAPVSFIPKVFLCLLLSLWSST